MADTEAPAPDTTWQITCHISAVSRERLESIATDQSARIAELEAALAKAVEALESIYEITVEPAETDHMSVRGWIEVQVRTTLATLTGDKSDDPA